MKLRYYTVIGFYRDNEQPWMGHATGKNATEAAIKAVKNQNYLNNWDENDDSIVVVEAIAGMRKGRLGNEECMTLSTLKRKLEG